MADETSEVNSSDHGSQTPSNDQDEARPPSNDRDAEIIYRKIDPSSPYYLGSNDNLGNIIPTMTVATYFGKLKTFWDQLDRYTPVPACVCGMSEEFMKQIDEEKFHEFLFGINQERYKNLRSQLLAQDPLPTLDWAYKAMNQEEQLQKRHQVVPSDPIDVMTFAVKAPHKSSAEYKPRFLPNVTCTYCHRVGHEESTCFGKNGFPEWWGDRP
ncbi:hypothetical protein LIER_37372 [Lithospermum erythrorhizon]|uniref:Uncharacterized protein n=1 Tax=Lithospermum erythrorhizon TaxID=34254 RepID=A0AAV3PKR6_LITER